MIKIKRIYIEKDKSDGYRILVDRLWPRGVSKDKAGIDEWMKEISPSAELRNLYSHDVSKWTEFKELYFKELSEKEDLVRAIIEKESSGPVTLVFAAKDEKHSNAAALKEYIENKMKSG